jgi:hypothetical protein
LPGPRDTPRAPDGSDQIPQPNDRGRPDHQGRPPVREPADHARRPDARTPTDRAQGAADRGQVTVDRVRGASADRVPGAADRVQGASADRVQPSTDRGQQPGRRLSSADERRMRVLESFPPGHPSSPYLADGTRRPRRPSPRSLQLPIPDKRDEEIDEPQAEGRQPKRGTSDNTVGRSHDWPNSDAPRRPEAGHRRYWTEVPRFMSRWADHETQWPRDGQPGAAVDRSRDAPGSWRSDSNLHLSPEDHSRTKDAISGMRNAESRVTEDLQDAVQESGFDAELVGLEFRCKSEDRLKEKTAEALQRRPDTAPEEAVRSVSDGIRYTVRLNREDYAGGYREVRQRLEADGYVMFYRKNCWEDPEYKGINTRWMTPNGQRFEVQFHTPESYHAKQEVTHHAYERIRNPLTTRAELAELEAFQREVSSWVPVPKGVTGIPDHRRDGS